MSIIKKSENPVKYKPIKDFPFYRVGNDGSVWCCQKRGKGAGKAGEWRVLFPRRAGNKRQYLQVILCSKSKRRTVYVHELVLEAFTGPRPSSGMEARHFPNIDTFDNRACNLSWGTRKQNQADRIIHGTDIRGEKQWKAVLTEVAVKEIRERRAKGERFSSLAREFSVSSSAIGDAFYRRSWKHVK